MQSFLKKIIQNKKREVEMSKQAMPLDSFRHKLKNSERDFKEALSKNRLSLIAEFKRASPSQDFIRQKDAFIGSGRFFEIISAYGKYADAISVLTDEKFFGGGLSDMEAVGKMTKLPILRKDFIIDEYQIYESRLYNADALLLISSELPNDKLNRFIRIAKSLRMSCLVEAHTEEELKRVLDSDAEIIGINNRNLDTLEIDTGTTLRLMGKIPNDKIVVSESGILSKDYVNKLKGKVNAILVGNYFMNSKNLEEEILSLTD